MPLNGSLAPSVEAPVLQQRHMHAASLQGTIATFSTPSRWLANSS